MAQIDTNVPMCVHLRGYFAVWRFGVFGVCVFCQHIVEHVEHIWCLCVSMGLLVCRTKHSKLSHAHCVCDFSSVPLPTLAADGAAATGVTFT